MTAPLNKIKVYGVFLVLVMLALSVTLYLVYRAYHFDQILKAKNSVVLGAPR